MRCPKCGFISFDDLTSCSKCTNDIADLTEELHGTCTGVEVGFFLGAVVKALDMDAPADFTSEVAATNQTTQQSFDASQQLDFNETFSGEIPFSLEEDGEAPLAAPAGDDVEIELGEVLPLDFSQLESDDEEKFDVTLETSVEEIGLDLSDTDEEETLSLDAEGIDLDNVPELDLTGSFDQTVPTGAGETAYTDNLGQIDEELEAHAEQLQSVNLENLDLSDLIAEPDEEGESFDETVDLGEMADAADQTAEIELTPEDIGEMTIDDSSIELDVDDDTGVFDSTLEVAAAESAELAVEGLDDLVIEETTLDEGDAAEDGDDFVDLSTLVDDAAEPSDSTQMLTRDELDLDQLSDDAGPLEGEVTQQLDVASLPDGELIPEEVEVELEPVEELAFAEEELVFDDVEPVSAPVHEETAGMPKIELVADDDDDDAPPEIPDLP